MDDKMRYALAISIDARSRTVDLEAEISQKVAIKRTQVRVGVPP